MATTTISYDSLQTAMAEVADAIAADDFALARRWLGRARAIFLALPVESSADDRRTRLREDMDRFAQWIDSGVGRAADSGRRLITTKTGFQR